MDKYFTSYTPSVRVKTLDITGKDKLDLTGDIISLSTNKAYGRCSGTWQIMLPHRQDVQPGFSYPDLIEPDDMVTIEMDAGDGNGFRHVMTGLVDRVSVVKQGGAVPQRSVKLSGRDLGKLLEKHDIFYDFVKWKETIKKQAGEGSDEKDTYARPFSPVLLMGTAATVMSTMFDIAFSKKLDLYDKIYFASTTDDDWHTLQPNLMSQTHCGLWQWMTQIENKPYNTLTTDSTPNAVGKFYVMLEKTPFDKNGKVERDDYKTATIDDTEIINEDLGISDNERVTFLFYNANALYTTPGQSMDSWAIEHGSFIEDEIKKHGLINHTITGNYAPPQLKSLQDPNAQAICAEPRKARQELFWGWYNLNHTYAAGTTTLHLRPDIRAGFQLLVKQGSTDKYMSYLVEQVAHQCNFHPTPSFTTTLHLTRGQSATPKQKEQAAPPEPVKEEPQKAEAPAPKPYDCDAAKSKVDALLGDFNARLKDIKKRINDGYLTTDSPEYKAIVEEKQSVRSQIDAIVEEAIKNGCDMSR